MKLWVAHQDGRMVGFIEKPVRINSGNRMVWIGTGRFLLPEGFPALELKANECAAISLTPKVLEKKAVKPCKAVCIDVNLDDTTIEAMRLLAYDKELSLEELLSQKIADMVHQIKQKTPLDK